MAVEAMVIVYSLGVIQVIHTMPAMTPPPLPSSATAATTTANGMEHKEKLPKGDSTLNCTCSDYGILAVA
jgi:hypothetical protein